MAKRNDRNTSASSAGGPGAAATAGERDVQFLCRFLGETGSEPVVRAQYVYSCRSLNELLYEEHVLNVADVHLIAGLLRETGFSDTRIYGNSRREPLSNALAPYVLGIRQIV